MYAALPRGLATRALFLVAMLSIGACQTMPPAPQQAELSELITATLEVVNIDPATRMLTLRREDGMLFDLYASQEVRNFNQIEVGDALRVNYEEKLNAAVLPDGQGAEEARAGMTAARAEPGAKPGLGAGVAVSVRVLIESVDLKRDIVVFSLASGELIAHRVETPEGRNFIKGLKVGDTVQLDYGEALALAIEAL